MKSRLTILGNSENKKNYYVVRCDCGTIKEVRKDHIRNNETLSCGCLMREISGKNNTTHGKSNTSEYKSWASMIYRCTNTNDKRYDDYGGRGITVCEEWKDFTKFMEDMKEKPYKGAQINRIDNEKGYYKGNCVWSSRIENQRNMRSSRYITYKNETKLLIEFAEMFNINPSTLSKRIFRSGWSVEDALETPLIKGQHKIQKENKSRVWNKPKELKVHGGVNETE